MLKKLFIVQILLFFAFCTIYAQGFVIHQSDGKLAVFSSANVDSVTMVTEDHSYLMGTWYLGFLKHGDDVTHYDGSEYMTFAGNRMQWGIDGYEPELYEIKYNTNSKYFNARKLDKTKSIKWYINKRTPDLLVLRDGDNYRYYYPTRYDADHALFILDPPSHSETSDINTILNYANGRTTSTQTPMGKHFENRHKTTEADREWLLEPSNEPDLLESAELTKWVAKTVTLYPYGSPLPADVNQHSIGDCCALAVLASFAYLYPDWIQNIITDNGNKTYTVKMYDPQGKPVDVCVSNKFQCRSDGSIGQVTGKNNKVTWATIMEKALMKWEKIYQCDGIEGIGTEHAAPPFTGNGDSFAFSPNSLYTSELKLAIEYCLGEGMITVGGFNKNDLMCGTLKTVTAHAFTFMLADDDRSIFYMRNPWGNGDNGEDGLLRIPDNRGIVQTIDARIVNPGAAAPYLRQDLQPYTPPKYVRRSTDIGVSPRLLNRIYNPNDKELW